MDKRLYILLLIYLYSLDVLAQKSSNDLRLLTGKVVGSDSICAVPFAFVANSQTGTGKETNDNGVFKLKAEPNDTIYFRCMGYDDTMFIVTEEMFVDTVLFCVNEKTYELESVDVLMFKSYASFRAMVSNMDMIEDNRILFNIGIDIRDVRRAKKEQEETFGVGLSFGSGGMTRKEKKYVAFASNEKRYERFREITSRENMRYLTKLNDARLDSFIVFLRTKHNINPEWSDYKMMEAINIVFEEFLALQGDTINISK